MTAASQDTEEKQVGKAMEHYINSSAGAGDKPFYAHEEGNFRDAAARGHSATDE
jgi:hypothetical protein